MHFLHALDGSERYICSTSLLQKLLHPTPSSLTSRVEDGMLVTSFEFLKLEFMAVHTITFCISFCV